MRYFFPLFLSLFLLNGFFPSFEPTQALPDFSSSKHPVEILTLLNLGLRRLAADIEMVRLLIYYGSSEAMADDLNPPKGVPLYPGIFPRAREILSLDPSFSYVRLYAAGALAFNLGRPDEALELMREGLILEPDNSKYKAYIAAIAFSQKGDERQAVEALGPYLHSPKTPSMIKNVAAFIYLRLKEWPQAAELYQELLNSKDAGYRKEAKKMLRKIKKYHHLRDNL